MKEFKSCKYNMDKGTVDATFSDGTVITLICSQIEKELSTTMLTRSHLNWLLEKEPLTYAVLALFGGLQSYLNQYSKEHSEQEKEIRQQIGNHYPTETAREIAREFMMYDS